LFQKKPQGSAYQLEVVKYYLQLSTDIWVTPEVMQTSLCSYPIWNSQVSNPSNKKLLDLTDDNDFQISALYSPQETGDVLNTVLNKNV
jgi:hypothetical protein